MGAHPGNVVDLKGFRASSLGPCAFIRNLNFEAIRPETSNAERRLEAHVTLYFALPALPWPHSPVGETRGVPAVAWLHCQAA